MTLTALLTYNPQYVKVQVEPASEQWKIERLIKNSFFYNEPDAYFNGKWQKGKRVELFSAVNKTLPFGLAKPLIQLLKDSGYDVRVNNKVKQIENQSHEETAKHTPKYTPRHYQESAIQSGTSNRYGVIKVPCGGGKTLIAEYIIARAKAKLSVLVTDGASLTDQTYEYIKSVFPEHNVYKWGDGSRNNKIDTEKPCIIVSTYHSLDKLLTDDVAEQVSCVVVDECHRIAAEMFSMVSKRIPNAYIRIGLSATDERDNEDTILVQGYLGERIYKIEEEELIKDGFLSRPHVGTIQLAYMSEDELKAFLKGRKCLIVTERVATVEKFQEQFPFIDALTGNTPKKEFKARLQQFKDAKEDVLVSTRVLDTGIDIPDIDTVIMFEVFKSSVKAEQTLGRATRPYEGKTHCECYIDVSNSKAKTIYRTLKQTLLTKRSHILIQE
jgi:superfamily II DNA or RNA helicase